nr:TIGR00266 family protein [Candidatus Magnetobacterium casensis]
MVDFFADKMDIRPQPSPTPSPTVPYEYLYRGAFTMLRYRLKAGEIIKAESDAMVAMSSTIDVEGKLEGGVLGGLGRMLSGEKFFFQTLTARRGHGEVLMSPVVPGDIMELQLDGRTNYIIQKDGFFAASNEVVITTKMQNLAKGLFSGEGFFVIKVGGSGTLFVSSYGAIHALDIPAGEEMIVDNGHLVAWPESVVYTIEKASSGWISSFTSGEGMVCRFRGPGRVLIQTRNPQGFGQWIRQFIRTGS